jgi:hypothetical protein
MQAIRSVTLCVASMEKSTCRLMLPHHHLRIESQGLVVNWRCCWQHIILENDDTPVLEIRTFYRLFVVFIEERIG